MRIFAAVAALLAFGLTSAAPHAASGDTRLTIVFLPDGADTSNRSRWTLACSPPGGTYPRRAAACAVLHRLGRSVFLPVPAETACAELYGGPQVVVVSGRVDGRPVWARFRRDDGCQLGRWAKAGALLPRTVGVG